MKSLKALSMQGRGDNWCDVIHVRNGDVILVDVDEVALHDAGTVIPTRLSVLAEPLVGADERRSRDGGGGEVTIDVLLIVPLVVS